MDEYKHFRSNRYGIGGSTSQLITSLRCAPNTLQPYPLSQAATSLHVSISGSDDSMTLGQCSGLARQPAAIGLAEERERRGDSSGTRA